MSKQLFAFVAELEELFSPYRVFQVILIFENAQCKVDNIWGFIVAAFLLFENRKRPNNLVKAFTKSL